MPRPTGKRHYALMSVCLSVPCLTLKVDNGRRSKLKIGRKEAHDTGEPWHHLEVKGQTLAGWDFGAYVFYRDVNVQPIDYQAESSGWLFKSPPAYRAGAYCGGRITGPTACIKLHIVAYRVSACHMRVRLSWRVLRHTVVCPNGHRCCQVCHARLDRATGHQKRCPLCRSVGTFDPAPQVDEELNRQQAKCPFVRAKSGQACQWVGPYGEMKYHIHQIPDPPREGEDPATADPPADADPGATAQWHSAQYDTSRTAAAWPEFSRSDILFIIHRIYRCRL